MNSFLFVKHKDQILQSTEICAVMDRVNFWKADVKKVFSNTNISVGLLESSDHTKYSGIQFEQVNNYYLVGDIRLDNYADLIKQFNMPSNTSDGRLVLHAYLKWGVDCVKHLFGDFAFCIWDENKNLAFCVRDQIGIKPLFYYHSADFFAVASDIKTLHCLPGVEKLIDENQIIPLLTYRTLNKKEFGRVTLYKKIYRAMPAEYLLYTNGEITVHHYWTLTFSKKINYKQESEYFESFREHMGNAVKCRARHVSNLGVELSGGIDSSIVTAFASQYHSNLHTFTNSPSKNSGYYNESHYAKMIAAHFNLVNHQVDIENFDLYSEIKNCLHYNDIPNDVTYCLLSIPLFKTVNHNKCNVMLSGFGGDECVTDHASELLTEYILSKHYLKVWKELSQYPVTNQFKSFLSLILKAHCPRTYNYIQHVILKNNKGYFYHKDYCLDDTILKKWGIKKRVKVPSHQYFHRKINDCVQDALVGELSGFLKARLETTAQCAKAYNVEYRYPMLDLKLLEYCASVPSAIKRRGNVGRYLARRSMENDLPSEIIWRTQKAGSASPAIDNFVFKENYLIDLIKNSQLNPRLLNIVGSLDFARFNDNNSLIKIMNRLAGVHIIEINELYNCERYFP